LAPHATHWLMGSARARAEQGVDGRVAEQPGPVRVVRFRGKRCGSRAPAPSLTKRRASQPAASAKSICTRTLRRTCRACTCATRCARAARPARARHSAHLRRARRSRKPCRRSPRPGTGPRRPASTCPADVRGSACQRQLSAPPKLTGWRTASDSRRSSKSSKSHVRRHSMPQRPRWDDKVPARAQRATSTPFHLAPLRAAVRPGRKRLRSHGPRGRHRAWRCGGAALARRQPAHRCACGGAVSARGCTDVFEHPQRRSASLRRVRTDAVVIKVMTGVDFIVSLGTAEQPVRV
jgi:hypothetical protein